jgi:hypothetical protein
VTVRVRFADLRSVTRSVTLDAPVSATTSLAEIAEELVRAALADHSNEKTITLVAISVSHLASHWDVQLELPLGLEDEKRRPGTRGGMARWTADRAIDMIRDRFGWDAVGYGSAMLGLSRSVPDEFASSPKRTSDQLGAEAIELTFDSVETRCKNVVGKNCRNCDAQRGRGCDQRFCDARRDRANISRSFGGDSDEGVDDAEYRA